MLARTCSSTSPTVATTVVVGAEDAVMRDWALQMRSQGDRAPTLLHQPSIVLGCVHYHGATIGMAERVRCSQNQAITSVPAASKPRRFTWPVPLSRTGLVSCWKVRPAA